MKKSFLARIFGLNQTENWDGTPLPTFKESIEALKHIPKFLSLVWQSHRGLTLAVILLRLINAGTPLASLYVGKLIIDEVVRLIATTGTDSYNYLWTLIALEFGIALFSDLLLRSITLVDALLGDLFSNESSVMLMRHAAKMDLKQFEDAEFYDKLERARRQTVGRILLLSQILAQIQDSVAIIFLATGLVFLNPWLIFILVLAVIPSFLSENYFNRSTYSLARNWTPERRELDYLRYVGASDETAKEVKIFGLSEFLIERFKHLADRYYLVNRSLAIKRAAWGGIFNTLGNLGYYAAYLYIVWQTIQGKLSLGDLTFLAGSFNKMQSTLQGILSRFSTISQNALYLQDLFDFFAMQPSIISSKEAQKPPLIIQSGFTFENVGFKYANSEIWALRQVSFHLKAGEKLALVGENGAGKTTLVKLLERLYDPDEGRILLDGVDIRNYDLLEYRKLIGVIFQDFVRFQMNISDNIAVGQIDERLNRSKIEYAAQQSLANSVIEKLPEGYDQMLGRRFGKGIELSGGEWQKVALGRSYMREAQLLILDEPTAALDARAEYEVFQRFSELTQGKSAVLISHRFSTVRMADRILVLSKGQMVEIGSHEELLEQNGLYAELFHLQAQGYQ